MKIILFLAIFILELMTGCSADGALSSEPSSQSQKPDNAREVDSVVAAVDGPCFYKGTIYSDGAASCQSGWQYRCNNSEWMNLGSTCTEETVATSRPCQFSGVTFPTGAASCQAGTQYRCEDGYWNSLGVVCPGGTSKMHPIPSGRTCMLDGGSTVATNSTICRTGTTFLCSDGEWINLGTLCR